MSSQKRWRSNWAASLWCWRVCGSRPQPSRRPLPGDVTELSSLWHNTHCHVTQMSLTNTLTMSVWMYPAEARLAVLTESATEQIQATHRRVKRLHTWHVARSTAPCVSRVRKTRILFTIRSREAQGHYLKFCHFSIKRWRLYPFVYKDLTTLCWY